MQYVLLFLEGVITFISPCLLPMLPIYATYFAGGGNNKSQKNALVNAIGFVMGFTFVFVALGAFAGSVGRLLLVYSTWVNIITGLIVVFFGLSYMGVFTLRATPLLGQRKLFNVMDKPLRFHSSIVFGAVFSVGWTPCVSAFLGAALMRASQQGSMLEGMLMLFVYSMGLGLPLIASAVLIHRLKTAFTFIQKHYKIINIMSGMLLVLVGLLMMTGLFGRYMSLFL